MSPSPLNRRQVLLGGVALGAAGGIAAITDLVAAASSGSRPTSGALRVGYLPITDAAPLLVAHGEGLFQAAGVEVEPPVMFRGWAPIAEAFVTRQVDVVHLLMPMAVQLRYALGAPARIIAWNHTNGSSLTVHPEITELAQLAGRKVAIPYWWSIHNIVLQDLLRHAGLRPVVRVAPSRAEGTVELIVMSPSDMVPGLASGAIGGYIVADPFNAAAEIKQVGRIQRFVGDVWRDHACCVVLTHQDVIDRHPDRVQALTDAIGTAQRRINQDRPAAAGLLTQRGYLPQPLPAITKALTYPAEDYDLHHPEWSGQRIGYQPFPFPSFTRALVESMHQTVVDGDTEFLSDIDPASAHQQLIDDRFVRTTLTRLGGPATFGLPTSLTRTEQVNPA